MADQTVTPAPALDHAAIAEGLGELVEGSGYSRLRVDGKTVAYIKSDRVAIKADVKLPAKLGKSVPEKSGGWANVKVADTAAARAVLEFVVAKATDAEDES